MINAHTHLQQNNSDISDLLHQALLFGVFWTFSNEHIHYTLCFFCLGVCVCMYAVRYIMSVNMRIDRAPVGHSLFFAISHFVEQKLWTNLLENIKIFMHFIPHSNGFEFDYRFCLSYNLFTLSIWYCIPNMPIGSWSFSIAIIQSFSGEIEQLLGFFSRWQRERVSCLNRSFNRICSNLFFWRQEKKNNEACTLHCNGVQLIWLETCHQYKCIFHICFVCVYCIYNLYIKIKWNSNPFFSCVCCCWLDWFFARYISINFRLFVRVSPCILVCEFIF